MKKPLKRKTESKKEDSKEKGIQEMANEQMECMMPPKRK